MDRITTIETELKNILLEIQTSSPLSEYTFYNDVNIINIDDECVVMDRGDYPSISIYLNPNEQVISSSQRAYRNKLSFELVCSVSLNDVDDTPRFAINQKMSELVSDIKAILFEKYNLNCVCDLVEVGNHRRVYNTRGDIFRAGDVIIPITVTYSQSRINPNLNINNIKEI